LCFFWGIPTSSYGSIAYFREDHFSGGRPLSRKGADDVQTAREGGDEVGVVFGGGGHRRRLYIWFLSVPPGSITLGTQILKFPVKPVPRLTLGK